jgi:hypothetical protein
MGDGEVVGPISVGDLPCESGVLRELLGDGPP